MSLQTLKKKSDANTTNQTNNSHKAFTGFTLNGGPRNLSYTGKSMKNSTHRTIFNGIYPVNYEKNVNQSIINSACGPKIEIRGKAPKIQKSVRNNNSMIHTKYKWIHGSTYPNVWVQPTDTENYDVYMKQLRCGNRCSDVSNNTEPCAYTKNCVDAFENMGVRINHSPIKRAKLNNSGIQKDSTLNTMSESEYISRIQCKCVDPECKLKPFPYYTTNPGTRMSSLVGEGAMSGETIIYKSAPGYYNCTTPALNIVDDDYDSGYNYNTGDNTLPSNWGFPFDKPTIVSQENNHTTTYTYQHGITGFNIFFISENDEKMYLVFKTYHLGSGKYYGLKTLTTDKSEANIFYIDKNTYSPTIALTTTLSNGIKYIVYGGNNYFELYPAADENTVLAYSPGFNMNQLEYGLESLQEQITQFTKIPLFSGGYYSTDTTLRDFLIEIELLNTEAEVEAEAEAEA